MKEWPKDLLELFKDPLFKDVHSPEPKITDQDRIKSSFLSINRWVEEQGRVPDKTAVVRPERSYGIQLDGIRNVEWKRRAMKPYDVYHLLD